VRWENIGSYGKERGETGRLTEGRLPETKRKKIVAAAKTLLVGSSLTCLQRKISSFSAE
jgi:hypothetical protein